MAICEQGDEFLRRAGGPGLKILRHHVHGRFQILFVFMDRADKICRLSQSDDIHASVGISTSDAADVGGAADGGHSAFASKYNAEWDLLVDHRLHHALIPLLKNVQWQSHS